MFQVSVNQNRQQCQSTQQINNNANVINKFFYHCQLFSKHPNKNKIFITFNSPQNHSDQEVDLYILMTKTAGISIMM